MTTWAIDGAGVLRANDGSPVATLEPELPVDLAAALVAAPRIARLLHVAERAEAGRRAADRASPEHRKGREDLARQDLAEVWMELRRLRADVDAANRQMKPPSSSGLTCSCPGDCGEGHLGNRCGATSGEVIRRHAGARGIWTYLADRRPRLPAVVALVTETGLGPRCQRCAWLHARKNGGTPP